MKKIDLIVKAPHFYTMEGEGVGYKSGVVMLVDGGKIIGFADQDGGEYYTRRINANKNTIHKLDRILD